MGGHGGLNILPQKSWNVYGQRNRQKVAEDEEAHREKEEAEQKQRYRGDRELRLQVLRRQAGLQDDSLAEPDESQDEGQDGPVFADGNINQAKKGHINFWSTFEKSSHNPEREAEKKQLERRRGDPKTRTSDARFDEQFALMHGLTGQAPWYARPQQSLYSTDTVQQSSSHADVRNGGRSVPVGAEAREGRPQHGRHAHRNRHGQKREKKAPIQHDSFQMASARSDLAAMVGQNLAHVDDSDRKARDTEERRARHKHKSKHRKHSDAKASKHYSREHTGRSRSPRVSYRCSERRRDSSSSSHDDGRRSEVRQAASKSAASFKAPSGGSKGKFEHLRRERLERERLESQRTKTLLKQHFSK